MSSDSSPKGSSEPGVAGAGAVVAAVVLVLVIQFAVGRLFAAGGAGKAAAAASAAAAATLAERPGGARLAADTRLHVARRLQHMLTGAAFVAVPKSQLLTREQSSATLLACAAGFYLVHLLRLRWPALQRALEAAVASIARPHEIAGAVPASFFFLLGSGLACAAFDLDVYAVSVAMLAVGDPAVSARGPPCRVVALAPVAASRRLATRR
jgi:hypothetical protein